jgi:hypothetical protein
MVADIRALIAAIPSATAPTVLMNPLQATSLATIAGTGLPGVIVSPNITAGLVIAVDSAAFIAALGAPRISISKEAVVHEDSVPAALATPGSPNVVAAPSRSLWQTDASGLRMIFDCSWAMGGAGRVSWMQGVLW